MPPRRATVPRVSTRGFYDLRTGAQLRRSGYRLQPRRYFESLPRRGAEIAVVIHGMRNDRAGAAEKFRIVRARLRALGYAHAVVGYTYDADVRGAHARSSAPAALSAARRIAAGNGAHLAAFIADFAAGHPRARVRLIGHSLGSEVIMAALRRLGSSARAPAVRSVHLFGASLPASRVASRASQRALRRAVLTRMVNCYCPTDEVLLSSGERDPLGLGARAPSRLGPRFAQRLVRAKSHRFASYAAALRSFP